MKLIFSLLLLQVDITEKMKHMSDPIQEAVLVLVEEDTKYKKREAIASLFPF